VKSVPRTRGVRARSRQRSDAMQKHRASDIVVNKTREWYVRNGIFVSKYASQVKREPRLLCEATACNAIEAFPCETETDGN